MLKYTHSSNISPYVWGFVTEIPFPHTTTTTKGEREGRRGASCISHARVRSSPCPIYPCLYIRRSFQWGEIFKIRWALEEKGRPNKWTACFVFLLLENAAVIFTEFLSGFHISQTRKYATRWRVGLLKIYLCSKNMQAGISVNVLAPWFDALEVVLHPKIVTLNLCLLHFYFYAFLFFFTLSSPEH